MHQHLTEPLEMLMKLGLGTADTRLETAEHRAGCRTRMIVAVARSHAAPKSLGNLA